MSALKQAVKSMMQLHESKNVYWVLQDMNRKIDSDYPLQEYDEFTFTAFIKTGLQIPTTANNLANPSWFFKRRASSAYK